ncbi:serine hydrolase [Microbacteriaceae bacterium 4G12]
MTKHVLSAGSTNEIVRFVEANKDKKTCALMVKRNDKIVYAANPNVVLPLASTVKLMVALEYSQQVAEGKIDPNEQVSIEDINKYYVPDTDGGAQEHWQQFITKKGLLQEDAVSLETVARGMMMFSSNANTEYLIERLGLSEINANIKELGLPHHQELFPIVASFYIPGYLQEELHVPKRQLMHTLQTMPQEEYRQYAWQIHERLKKEGPLLGQRIPLLLGKQYEKVWSDRLPAASATDYIMLLERVNGDPSFPKPVRRQWTRITETSNAHHKNRFRHVGQKNGYTPSVLTNAAYATDNDGNKTEIVFLANELNDTENEGLRKHLSDFTFKVFSTKTLRATR